MRGLKHCTILGASVLLVFLRHSNKQKRSNRSGVCEFEKMCDAGFMSCHSFMTAPVESRIDVKCRK